MNKFSNYFIIVKVAGDQEICCARDIPIKSLLLLHILTLFPPRYLCPLYEVLLFSRSTCQIHFKLGKYLTHHKYFQIKSKWHPRSRDFLMTSSYFVKFSEILMKFQFEITFDVKNYFLLLLRFLKENLLEISNK